MTDFEDIDAAAEEETERKKKGGKEGKEGGDAQSLGEVSVSEGFYSYMTGIGASSSLIASVLKSWTHLRGAGLLRAISEFVKGASSRATAHIQVNIDQGKGFSVLHNFVVEYFKGSNKSPVQTQNHRIDRSNSFDPK
ncbi:MAG: hypothetical protein PHD48_03050 [Alphaproteobacteria bacterium]|nr:hypothetical protein [Alphaproteobacteria bacterium]